MNNFPVMGYVNEVLIWKCYADGNSSYHAFAEALVREPLPYPVTIRISRAPIDDLPDFGS